MVGPESSLSREEFEQLPLQDLESALQDLEAELGSLMMTGANGVELSHIQGMITQLTERIDEVIGMKG